MSFIATEEYDFDLWNFIVGDVYVKQDKYPGIYEDGMYGMSIACNRFYYLQELEQKYTGLKVACRDPENDFWTKWEKFPGKLWESLKRDQWFTVSRISAAIDVHRSVLPNEIVIESDYPTYEENYEASKIIGKILEHKGFSPLYYYSGNKSIHIHVYFDWKVLDAVFYDEFEKQVKEYGTLVVGDIYNYQKKFMDWLRKKMISCWDTKMRQFDEDLIRGTHLIRAELSRNKKGFKTFLGYTYKDMSFVPYICNEKNMIYPKLGKIKMSQPWCIGELMEEFHESRIVKSRIDKLKKKHGSLDGWIKQGTQKKLRSCIKIIMSDDFKKVNDGFKRGMFYLLNELRAVFGDDQARIIINDWNLRMGDPIKKSEIEYRFKIKHYTLTCEKIHKFLKQLGFEVEGKCILKTYK